MGNVITPILFGIIFIVVVTATLLSVLKLSKEAGRIYKALDEIKSRALSTTDLEELKVLFEEAKNVGSFEKNTHREKHRVLSIIETRYVTLSDVYEENHAK